MSPTEKIKTYLRAILRAEDLETAKSEARLALQIAESAEPKPYRKGQKT